MNSCPRCGSIAVASRRTLFHHLVGETDGDEDFAWYGFSEQDACPPKSLFVVLLALLLILVVPAVIFWILRVYPALPWLAGAAMLLLVSLAVDARLTYRRYRRWASCWLCGNCRHSFRPFSHDY